MEEDDQDSVLFVVRGSINIVFAVVVLVAAVILFHLYFRCWLLRRFLRRQNAAEDLSSGRHRHRHRSAAASEITSVGLDRSAIMSLPTFLYDAKIQGAPLECAVCISEFQPNEAGRVLPGCNHRFHVDCIDMWLQSHSDCPLCRARVKAQPVMNRAETSENPPDGEVLGPAQNEGLHVGLSSSARTSDAGPMEQHLAHTKDSDPDRDGSIGPDLELGLRIQAI